MWNVVSIWNYFLTKEKHVKLDNCKGLQTVTKKESSKRHHIQARQEDKVWQNPLSMKRMIILHVILCHPIPLHQTVNTKCYSSFLQYHLYHKFRKKPPELDESAIILHNNATAHSVYTVKSVLWHCSWEFLKQSSHSHNFCACDYNLIPKLKQSLHGKWYANRWDISTAIRNEVTWISTSVEYDGILCLLLCWQWTTDNPEEIWCSHSTHVNDSCLLIVKKYWFSMFQWNITPFFYYYY